MSDRPVVVVSTSPVLANAYAAALAASGWCAVRALCTSRVEPSDVADPPNMGLVQVADEHGAAPVLPQGFFDIAGTRAVVVVGGRCAAAAMLTAVQRGARFVDAEQPLQAQIRAIQRVLTAWPQKADSPGAVTRRLHDRVREAAALGGLTRRERAVLEALRRGESATGIAARWVVSLPTVRTHIRAVLRKLDVSSQLAAVAVAQRAACPAPTWFEPTPQHHQN